MYESNLEIGTKSNSRDHSDLPGISSDFIPLILAEATCYPDCYSKLISYVSYVPTFRQITLCAIKFFNICLKNAKNIKDLRDWYGS